MGLKVKCLWKRMVHPCPYLFQLSNILKWIIVLFCVWIWKFIFSFFQQYGRILQLCNNSDAFITHPGAIMKASQRGSDRKRIRNFFGFVQRNAGIRRLIVWEASDADEKGAIWNDGTTAKTAVSADWTRIFSARAVVPCAAVSVQTSLARSERTVATEM